MSASQRFLHNLPYLLIPTSLGVIAAFMVATHLEARIMWSVAAAGLVLGLLWFARRVSDGGSVDAADDAIEARGMALHLSPVAWVPVAIALALAAFYLFA